MAQRSRRKETRSQKTEKTASLRQNPQKSAGGARVAVLSVGEYLELLASHQPGESLDKSWQRQRAKPLSSGKDPRITEAEEALQQVQAALEALDPDRVRH